MNLFGIMEVSGSALEAERVRAEVVAANMANAETTQTPQGGPYQRQHVVFSSAAVNQPSSFAQALLSQSGLTQGVGLGTGIDAPNAGLENPGVKVAAVVSDTTAPLRRYDPGHPDADKSGYVSYPNINPLSEMVDLMGAERSYGMNVSAVTASKNMITSTMTILA